MRSTTSIFREVVSIDFSLLMIAMFGLSLTFMGFTDLNAQASPGVKRSHIVRDLFSNSSAVATNPQSFGILLLLGMTPYIAHEETNRPFRSWPENITIDHTFELGEYLGSGSLQGLSSISLYSAGKLFGLESLASLGSDLFSAQAISSFVSGCLKAATARTRPDGTPYSYPSGHSTVSFSTAGVIWRRCGKVPGVIAETVATYIALSRLQENKHYITDIIGGCVLGNYVAHVVTRDTANRPQVILSPTMAKDGLGFSVALHFQ